jgi:hypothetical protein
MPKQERQQIVRWGVDGARIELIVAVRSRDLPFGVAFTDAGNGWAVLRIELDGGSM